MFQVKQNGPVTVFRMGRHVGKTEFYPVHAFLVDETLIDSGARHLQESLSAEMKKRRITTLINTHHNEDHIWAGWGRAKLTAWKSYIYNRNMP